MDRSKKKRLRLTLAVLSAFLTVVLANTLLRAQFRKSEDLRVEITALAEKRDESCGTDVRIKYLEADGTNLRLTELDYSEAWVWDAGGEFLEVRNPVQPVSVSIDLVNVRELHIGFLQNIGSGKAEVAINRESVGIIDIYGNEYGTIKDFYFANHGISFAEHPAMTGSVFLLLYAAGLFLLESVSEYQRSGEKIRKEIFSRVRTDSVRLLVPLSAGVIISCLLIYGEGSDDLYYKCIFVIGLLLMDIVLVLVDLGIRFLSVKYPKTGLAGRSFGKWILFLGVPASTFILLEKMQGHDWTKFDFSAFGGNLLVYLCVYLLLFLIVRNSRWSGCAYVFLFMAASMANYFVLKYRGSVILPADIFAADTAVRVAGAYELLADAKVTTSLWLSLVLSGTIMLVPPLRITWRLRDVGGCTAVVLGLIFTILYRVDGEVGYWDTESIYAEQGTVLSFTLELKHMMVEPPEGYSAEEVYQLAEKTSGRDGDFKPNLIVIMDEALADLELEGMSEDVLGFIHGLKENVVKGDLYVSTIGGGTSNTEYEFLTNNTMAFFPWGSIPYVQFKSRITSSLASQLADQGYKTAAIHPFDGGGYSRDQVYPQMGFQQIYFEEDFTDAEYIRGYISDHSSFEKVMEIYEENKTPSFIFNVTMQNHSSYGREGFASEISFDGSRDYPDAEEYLTLVKETDMAYSELIQYFAEEPDPTAVVIFGDHRPALSEELYESLESQYIESEGEFGARQKARMRVPFLIWTNFDIEERDHVQISANYLSAFLLQILGMEMTGYQEYLMDLYGMVPAITRSGHLESDGIWYEYFEDTDVTEKINEYERIQYNNVFGKQYRINEFFE